MESTLNKIPSLKLSGKTKSLIADAAVYSFIMLFIYTATSKVQSFQSFKLVLSKSVLIGEYNHIVAWAVPAIEFTISVLLILPLSRKTGLLSSLGIMIVFTAYLIYMVNSGTQLICTCGGVISSLTWQQHIWFNAVFILIAAAGIKFYKSEEH